MSQVRLLVVDDEPFNLEIIGEYFADSGYAIDSAADGEEAWRLLQENPPYDVIILDRMMPRLDGMALLQRIKAAPHLEAIPVIMQTAAGDSEKVRQGLAAGAYYYLVKPYARESLLAIVRGALADATQRQNLQARLARYSQALRLLDTAEFSLRTIDEAGTLAAFVAQACPQPERAVLGISELLVNAIEHGNLGIGYEEKAQLKREERWPEEIQSRLDLPENQHKRVRVIFQRSAGQICLRISDQGDGFDWRPFLDFDPGRAFDPNGRGIALARLTAFDSLSYEGCGNSVCACFHVAPGEGETP